LSEFERGSAAGERLRERLEESDDAPSVTIVSLEEQLRGWLAQIHRLNEDPIGQIPVYQRLQRRLEFFSKLTVLAWENADAELFISLRKQGVRIGAMDLKIACMAINRRARLLTRNTADFTKVPGLQFENWLGI
jgi:tRNA(fMet)-specific endonuclease VapC